MVNLLFVEDDEALTKQGRHPLALRPGLRAPAACSPSPRSISANSTPAPRLKVFGQELNPESYAICKSRHAASRAQDPAISRSATRSPRTAMPASTFDYCISNPPFGVEWKKVEERDPRRAREARHCAGGSAPGCRACRRLVAVRAAHDVEVPARRAGVAPGCRAERPPVVHRRRRVGRERDPALDHRERLARSHHRACLTNCSTTQASAPTFGSSPTRSAPNGAARSS